MNIVTEFRPSPEQLAELFCNLACYEMARFFEHAHRTVKNDGDWASGGIYAQALHVRQAMPIGTPGAEFLMDLAAPYYAHTLMYIDANGERERA